MTRAAAGPKEPPPELEVRSFASQAEFREWLAAEHARAPGLWLRFAKKASGVPTVTYAEALEVALCYGWIDGQSKGEDATWYRQRWTPRRARSVWSRINVAKAEELVQRGQMQPAGLAEVERAKADGRWAAAYDGPASATVPPDLQAALGASPAAAEAFAQLTGQNRYAILHRLQLMKTPAGRAKRVAAYVAMLERGEVLHP